MKPTKFAAVGLAVALLAAPSGAVGGDSRPEAAHRTLAVVPFYAPERMWHLYSPFVEFLGRATGERWELSLPASHAALIDELCAGRVDVALVGPVPLARANKRCGVVPILAALGPDGKPDYHAVLLTTDPSVTSVAALRGKEIGFFKGSTAAHVVPVKMLAEAGLPSGAYQPVFLESQDRLVEALLAHKVAGAGVKSALHRRFAKEGSLRVLATSEPLPNFAFAALPSLAPAARRRFEAALLGLRPRERAADAKTVEGWDDEVRTGFVRPAPGYLTSVLGLLELSERLLGDGR